LIDLAPLMCPTPWGVLHKTKLKTIIYIYIYIYI